MARTEIPLTSDWVSIGIGPMNIEVKEYGDGPLSLNDAASDTAAKSCMARPGWEFREFAAREVFAKGDGYTIIKDVDGA